MKEINIIDFQTRFMKDYLKWGRAHQELSMDEKNAISHRGKATDELLAFLNNYIKTL